MAAIDRYVDSSVSVITLANSREGNRLNPELFDGLREAIREADGNPGVRAIVIRSDGPVFCHGMDLPALRTTGWDLERIKQAVGLYTDLLYLIHTLGKPVIAVVRGEVKAGGVGLAAACDLVIGTPEANFEMAEVLFGILPANVLPFLMGPRLPLQKARALVLTAKKVAGAEALRLGLLDELVTDDELEKKTKEILKRLLSFSPRALAETKRLTLALDGRDLPRILTLTRDALVTLLADRDTQKAIEGFLEGELPPWSLRFKPQRPLTSKE
jgi:enoyl-CoA hydratase/carnithine racemase